MFNQRGESTLPSFKNHSMTKKVKVTLKTGKQIEVLPMEMEGLRNAGLLKEAPPQKKEEKLQSETKEEKLQAETKVKPTQKPQPRPANITQANIKVAKPQK